MGLKVQEIDIEPNFTQEDDFQDANVKSVKKKMGIDARRRLENRKADLCLQRELRDYDWDN